MHELIQLLLWAVVLGACLSVLLFVCILMIGP